MTETPSINIQINQEALRRQIEWVITQAMRDAAMKLRLAADQIDAGFFLDLRDEQIRDEYQRGFKAGQDARNETKETK